MTCNEEGSLALHPILSITGGSKPARRATDAGRVPYPRQSMGPSRAGGKQRGSEIRDLVRWRQRPRSEGTRWQGVQPSGLPRKQPPIPPTGS